VLYYADRYEKEPLRLVLSAFFWGAWPAFAIGLVVVLVFRLPVELWGRDAVEAVRMGLLAPVIEELVNGAVLIVIMFRFRHEIDSVHDGIIYGAAVGLGFAMTANMLSYMGGFLTHGFVELQRKVFAELAFRKAQQAAHPDQPDLAVEVDDLRTQLHRLTETATPATGQL